MTNLSLIQAAITRLGITRAELATRAGISYGLIGRYLNGKISIGLANAPKIAAVLGLTPAQVCFGEPQEVEPAEKVA